MWTITEHQLNQVQNKQLINKTLSYLHSYIFAVDREILELEGSWVDLFTNQIKKRRKKCDDLF